MALSQADPKARRYMRTATTNSPFRRSDRPVHPDGSEIAQAIAGRMASGSQAPLHASTEPARDIRLGARMADAEL